MTMYWSHTDGDNYRKWLKDIGFEIVEQVFVPEGKGGHQKYLLGNPER